MLLADGPFQADTRFNVGIGLDKLAAAGRQRLDDIALGVNLVVGRTAQDGEQVQACACRQVKMVVQLPLLVHPEAVHPGVALLTLVQEVDVPLCRLQLQVSGL